MGIQSEEKRRQKQHWRGQVKYSKLRLNGPQVGLFTAGKVRQSEAGCSCSSLRECPDEDRRGTGVTAGAIPTSWKPAQPHRRPRNLNNTTAEHDRDKRGPELLVPSGNIPCPNSLDYPTGIKNISSNNWLINFMFYLISFFFTMFPADVYLEFSSWLIIQETSFNQTESSEVGLKHVAQVNITFDWKSFMRKRENNICCPTYSCTD